MHKVENSKDFCPWTNFWKDVVGIVFEVQFLQQLHKELSK